MGAVNGASEERVWDSDWKIIGRAWEVVCRYVHEAKKWARGCLCRGSVPKTQSQWALHLPWYFQRAKLTVAIRKGSYESLIQRFNYYDEEVNRG